MEQYNNGALELFSVATLGIFLIQIKTAIFEKKKVQLSRSVKD